MSPFGVPDGLVCHVLLLETDTGLALVDCGFGTLDIASPAKRCGPIRHFIRPAFDEAETAIRQVERLGHRPSDVRDIVVTHFDADHVGGLSDFPWARVHVTADEAAGALRPVTLLEKRRYRSAQRDHGPELVPHTPGEKESWRGFTGVKELTEIAPGIVLISLPGHTRGHAAVAVDAGDHWVLHVGDSFYHRSQLGSAKRPPVSLRVLERAVAFDRDRLGANLARLTELWNDSEPGLVLVNAHDPTLLHRARSR
ncbi:MBL fold metallo-hydrolase [Stackebrandtia nassauensis]|uniref:Beta-lactamase domain protein n=1 Tax=Stackebrandtia nassauensis (strain DSM 44728 / CIP 108903 / NRRL B-16338 / NBRC 102104 / LLR-40K-21) TaxID=446470 RepID=D3PXL2_STANL|nr:MBL fold metallo-hydrolase [Stackebrandtia nassauensis]ADD43342.1 beta-lactamase domain protein [Stackebrandtia nassauensis DSM 44728]